MGKREVIKVVKGQAVSDGDGVQLTRVIGNGELKEHDPFLLLDEMRSDNPGDYIGGFPDHPHRGFETVSYMLAGSMEHHDSTGESGIIGAGGVQWMTAGRGVIHSELPKQDKGLLWGFQLWLNLPADEKMSPARYRNFAPEDIPQVLRDDGAIIKIIAGEVDGVKGAVSGISTDPLYIDIALPPHGLFTQSVNIGHSSFAYVIEGTLEGENLQKGSAAVFGEGDFIEIGAGASGARVLVFAARPLNEPIARYGPFVMNTKEEIQQAIKDYNNGTLTG